jgi:ADP-ribose pyrophosphatase
MGVGIARVIISLAPRKADRFEFGNLHKKLIKFIFILNKFYLFLYKIKKSFMKVVNKEKLEKVDFLKMFKYNIEHKDKIFYREFIEIGDAVCAVVYNTKTDKYVFVKQYRPGTNKELIELVGGLPNENLTPVQCIRIEVLEETGYMVDTIELMTITNFAPCYSTEKLHMYYITVSEKIETGGGLEHEDEYVEVVEMYKENILDFDFQSNSDAKTMLALSLIGLVGPFKNVYRKILMENPDLREGGC